MGRGAKSIKGERNIADLIGSGFGTYVVLPRLPSSDLTSTTLGTYQAIDYIFTGIGMVQRTI